MTNTVSVLGLLRTLAAGGWIYITSSDDHGVHDVSMICYIFFGLLYMAGSCIALKKLESLRGAGTTSFRFKLMALLSFLATMVPLIIFFIRHKSHRIPGAYTTYAFFEWSLIIFDVGFDAASALDLKRVSVGFSVLPSGGVNGVAASTAAGSASRNRGAALGVLGSLLRPIVSTFQRVFTRRQIRNGLVDIYLAYVFWSCLTMVPLTIWYFPLWSMGLSGFEAIFFITLSPAFLGIRAIRMFVLDHEGLFQLLSMLGVASYLVQDPLVRLFMVGFGAGFSCLVWMSKLLNMISYDGLILLASSATSRRKSSTATRTAFSSYKHKWELTSWLLGLVLCNIMKYGWYSNDPIWSIMYSKNGGWNTVGLVIGVLCAIQVMRRSGAEEDEFEDAHEDDFGDETSGRRRSSPSRSFIAKKNDNIRLSGLDYSSGDVFDEFGKQGNWFLGALGVGAALFSLHHNLVDSGLLCRWSVDGYPTPGPEPAIFGPVVMGAIGLGILYSLNDRVRNWMITPRATIFASIAVFVLYYVPKYVGFFAGLFWAVWVVAITPTLFTAIKNYRCVGKCMIVGCLTYQLLSFGSIWTVAYAFVPGGWVLRERTHIVFLFSQVFLFLGLRAATAGVELKDSTMNPGLMSPASASSSANAPSSASAYKSRKFVSIMDTIGNNIVTQQLLKRTRQIGAILVAMCLLFVVLRISKWKPVVPYHGKDRILTTGIWTIHFGIDDGMWESHERMANLIGELELDVVGLLESDTSRIINGNRDLTQYLAETLHMYADYGPGPTKHTWGCSMLSKFPIVRSTHHLLPSPVGELACAIHATLDVYGTEVDVIVSHNGQEEDFLDRTLQTQTLASIMKKSKNPFVFLGYVVTNPHDVLYRTLSQGGNVKDIDPDDTDRWCEYIFYRGVKRVGYARVSHGHITDTEVQVGKFVVGKPGQHTLDWWKDTTGQIPEHEVPQGYRFPPQFKNWGVRGHYYHVFDGSKPKYFK